MLGFFFSFIYSIYIFTIKVLFTMIFSKEIFDAHIRHDVNRPSTAVSCSGPLLYGLVICVGPGLVSELVEGVFFAYRSVGR